MKSKLLLFVFSATMGVVAAQQHVSTEPQKKNVLLEEFTGIHCGNCPDGHKIANNLIAAQPDVAYTLAIHSGYYAVPKAGEPDYRIAEGALIDSYFKVEGYPSAVVNRKTVSVNGQDLTVLNRSNWTKVAKAIHSEDSPVNLWMDARFDGSSRTLNVDVEAYYTSNPGSEKNFLHVVLAQNNIKGYQAGGLLGSDYIHRHQLKAYITPVWGDTIFQPAQSQLIKRTYSYTLPEAVNDIPVVAEDIEVYVYVTTDKVDIQNVIAEKPSYINYTKPLKITLSPPKEGYAQRYGFNFFDLNVKNESHRQLTVIDFEVTVNGVMQTVQWTGDIPAYQTRLIRLPLTYTILENNTFNINAVKINDTNVSNTPLTGSFTAPLATTPTLYTEITTDVYADENIYSIKDSEGNIVHSFGPYPSGLKKLYKETVVLEAGKTYCFEVIDLWGDGVSGGSYKLRKADESLFAQNSNILLFGTQVFFATTLPEESAIAGVTGKSPVSAVADKSKNIHLQGLESGKNPTLNIYSIDGKCLLQRELTVVNNETIVSTDLPAGLYLLNIKQNTGSETLKLILP